MPSLPPRHAHAAALQRHHSAQANEFYGEVTFRSRKITCAITRRAGEAVNNEGGIVDASTLVVRVNKTLFSVAPAEKELITALGETWIISTVAGLLSWEQEWVLTLGK